MKTSQPRSASAFHSPTRTLHRAPAFGRFRLVILLALLALLAPWRAVAQEWITFSLRAPLPYVDDYVNLFGRDFEGAQPFPYVDGFAGLGPLAMRADDSARCLSREGTSA
jgi:hypothetical protein